jgi:hypothetical protein
MSYVATDVDAVLALADQLLQDGAGAKKTTEALKGTEQYLHESGNVFAADEIISIISSCCFSSGTELRYLEWGKQALRRWVRLIPGFGLQENLEMLRRQKFPGLTINDIQNAVHKIVACRPEFKEPEVMVMGNCQNVFLLRKKEAVDAA